MRREDVIARGTALGGAYRLAPPRALQGGGAGGFSGRRGGQSVEFHDYRGYLPGDDVRRVDWRAFARSGQMLVKLFREEVAPVVEVHLDTSASMGAYGGKVEAALFLAAFLRRAALEAEARPVLCRDGERFGGEAFPAALAGARFDGTGTPERIAPAARNAMRFVLSDYLFGNDARGVVARQAEGSAAFTPVMILAESELRPPWRGLLRLRDVEDGRAVVDVAADEGEVAAYQKRLAAHRGNVEALARMHGGRLVAVETADAAVAEGGGVAAEEGGRFRAFADALAGEGVVRPC